MNYFEFYDLPISFNLDSEILRRQFLKFSKKYHPDFYTMESEAKQAEILELSTTNNEAYKLLKDQEKRIKYILELKGLLGKDIKPELPQSFLMDMMDINEQVMELQFEYDPTSHQAIQQDIDQKEQELLAVVQPIFDQYDDHQINAEELATIRDYYLQSRYLKRLKENMQKII
ncbi:Fe-S protein assembly co-chaperone HscB [Aureispira anguillae]|uniref:Fe-S protein assembly co-chaperone HscB n=1 Tax=Aureispira anguillae TaxID=2864201 RepID=A0A915YHB4_9BACT|nr:Fe-S protein assembly co-chaperone HscB [Aureispira anguillae]BDS13168.1 Fe-S protein assembly co-chaperone HscB [Aureispira anguillae]